MSKNETTSETLNEFTITRIFNAKRAYIFKIWSEAEHLANWWGPKGFALHVAKLDFRSGGSFHFSMTSAQGDVMWAKFVYKEVVIPERIVFINSFSDDKGVIARAPFNRAWPLEVLTTVLFTEEGNKTAITLKSQPINATTEEINVFTEEFRGMQQGYTETFNQLDDYLARV